MKKLGRENFRLEVNLVGRGYVILKIYHVIKY